MPTSYKGMWKTIEEGAGRAFFITPKQTLSYSDLREAISRWLAWFDRAGMQPGDRLVIQTDNDFAAASCFIAALLDGKVPVNLAADTPALRLASILKSVGASSLINDRAFAGPEAAQFSAPHFVLGSEARKPPRAGLGSIFKFGGGDRLAGLPRAGTDREPALPDDGEALAYILFTSGSTAAPTGVCITAGNLFANLDTLSRLFGYDRDSRIFNDMVLAHTDGMTQGPILALANGCAVIRADGFELSRLEDWLLEIRKQRATDVITVPTVWAMIDAYAAYDDYFDAPECRSLQSVAAKLSSDLWDRIESRFGKRIASHYGLTETVASALYAGDYAEMGARGTLGKPVDCEARIDPDATNGEGELQLRGENVFPGYWNNSERTSSSFTKDGWLKTGDLAAQDPDGSFRILGRLKNVIMSGGFLIRPDEIDEAILRHPGVIESVTVTLEDATFGEIVGTAVVTDKSVSIEELSAHARAHLEGRKVPRKLAILPAIDRGLSGKPVIAKVQAALLGHDGSERGAARTARDTQLLDDGILALAASIFRMPREDLSLQSGPDDVKGWDSFSQLTLIMEAEQNFAVAIPASRVATIASLKDLRDAVGELVA